MQKKTILELNRINTEQFHEAPKIPVSVMLDDIRSLNNIGSVFRTADAFTISHIYLCGITATPPSPEIHKTALGAEYSVGWTYHADAVALAKELTEQGKVICALEQVHGSIPLQEFKFDPKEEYVIVAGNEVKGVNQEIVDIARYAIEIPQCGTKHSLNVSISAGIALWEAFKQLKQTVQ